MNIERWEDCKNQIISIENDPSKIESIMISINKRESYINNQKITSDSVSFIIEGYYEIIRELLTALLMKDNLRSKNHKCLISYFYNYHKELESEAHLISQLSHLRNRLNYYGELIPIEFYEQKKEHILKTMLILKKLIKQDQ